MRRCAQAVDQHCRTGAFCHVQLGQQQVQHLVCQRVGGLQGPTPDAGFTVNAHAEFDFRLSDLERCAARFWYRAGRQGHADGAAGFGGFLCGSGYLGQRSTCGGARPGDLERENHAGHAAALVALGSMGAGNVIGYPN